MMSETFIINGVGGAVKSGIFLKLGMDCRSRITLRQYGLRYLIQIKTWLFAAIRPG